MTSRVPSFPLRRRAVVLLTVLLALGLTVPVDHASARVAYSDTFKAGTVWRGQFASPSILKVGDVYWAYATATGGNNLPAMWSRDLSTWRARGAYPAASNPSAWNLYNDAMPWPAKWAGYYQKRWSKWYTAPWAPSVGRVYGKYVAAYSVPINREGRRCISMATSASPAGPFRDRSTRPIVCSGDPMGSIDPQVYTPGNGKAYLIWKNAGRKGSHPTRIWSRQLATSGTTFAAGSKAHSLLATAARWEGNVIENPAMIKYANRYYLFYSGHDWRTTAYATGYAFCRGPLGPCRRPVGSKPILSSGGGLAGPGGASPIVGPSGALRLAYHAWRAGRTGIYDVRSLHMAVLAVDRYGHLRVTYRG